MDGGLSRKRRAEGFKKESGGHLSRGGHPEITIQE
jgi:hypothetical protein